MVIHGVREWAEVFRNCYFLVNIKWFKGFRTVNTVLVFQIIGNVIQEHRKHKSPCYLLSQKSQRYNVGNSEFKLDPWRESTSMHGATLISIFLLGRKNFPLHCSAIYLTSWNALCLHKTYSNSISLYKEFLHAHTSIFFMSNKMNAEKLWESNTPFTTWQPTS